MNDEVPANDRFADLLAAWDEALQGETPLSVDIPEPPPELRPRLERGLACLNLLRGVLRPASGEGPAAGGTLGPFVVRRELGRGAHGIVFLAHDPRLGRDVALKVPRPESLATPELRQRFLREARAAAGLDHPNLVPVHEAGEAGPVCYITSPYYPGPTLADWLRQRTEPVPPALAATLVAALAGAVQHAHERGVVHRDLKPANILLQIGNERQEESSLPTPRITDFGLAKVLDGDASQTASGAILGTPSYMAPEQAEGKKDVGPAADVYGLGTILYELLTGRPPFQAETVLDLLEQARSQEPVAPRRLRPRLPRDLETVCLKCLEKQPRQRYPSARALAEDLDRYQRGLPVLARPVGAPARAWRWCRRNRPLAVAAGLALAALLAVLGLSVGFGVERSRTADRLRDARDDAEAQRVRVEQEQGRTISALRESELLSSRLALEQGQALCLRGEVGHGLLSLAYGLTLCPDGEDAFRLYLRFNLDAWRRQVHPLRAVLPHPASVRALAAGPDGRTLLAAGGAQPVAWWDAAGGGRAGSLAGDPAAAVLATSTDGRALLTAGEGRPARLWDLSAGKPAGLPIAGTEGALAAALSRDGRLLATADRQGIIQCREAATGRAVGPPVPHGERVFAIAFAADGRSFWAGGQSGTLRRWATDTGLPLGSPLSHAGTIWALACSPDGRAVLVGSGEHTARLWDSATGRPIGPPLEHGGMVFAVAFSPDGRTAATGSADHTARLWDVATGQPLGPSLPHGHQVFAVAFGPQGKWIATGGRDQTVRIWEVTDPGRGTSPGLEPPVLAQGYSPDGRIGVLARTDRKVRLWDLVADRQIGRFLDNADPVGLVAFSPDGRTLAARGPDSVVRLYDPATGVPRGEPLTHPALVWALAFRPDSKVLATGTDGEGKPGHEVRLWDTATGRPLGRAVAHPSPPSLLAFSPDGRTLLAAGGQQVSLQEVGGERSDFRLLRPCGEVTAAAFSRDGRLLLTAGKETVARLWETATGSLVRELPGHEAPVSSVAIAPDGRTAATGTIQGQVRRWDLAGGVPLGPPLRHLEEVTALAFSPDGRFLLSAGEDATAQLWDAATGRPVGSPLKHPQRINFASFVGPRTVRTGSIDGVVRTCAVPDLLAGPPQRILREVEVLTGLTLEDRTVRVLGAVEWEERRRRLSADR